MEWLVWNLDQLSIFVKSEKCGNSVIKVSEEKLVQIHPSSCSQTGVLRVKSVKTKDTNLPCEDHCSFYTFLQ